MGARYEVIIRQIKISINFCLLLFLLIMIGSREVFGTELWEVEKYFAGDSLAKAYNQSVYLENFYGIDSMVLWIFVLILELVLIGVILFKIGKGLKADRNFDFPQEVEKLSKPSTTIAIPRITVEEREILNSVQEIHLLFIELKELDKQVFMLELDLLLVSLSIKRTSGNKNDWYCRSDNFKTNEEHKRALSSRINYVKVRYLMKFLELINHPIREEGKISQGKMISGFWKERDLLHSFQSVVGIPLACYIHLLIDGSDDFTL